VRNVTHLGRGPTAAQKAALLWTTPGCAVAGCARRRTETDHSIPWAQTRHTRLDELDPLCPFHHDLKTRLGWALVSGKGKRDFVAPDDPRHPEYRQARAGPERAFGRTAAPAGAGDGVRPPTAAGSATPPGRASRPSTNPWAGRCRAAVITRPARRTSTATAVSPRLIAGALGVQRVREGGVELTPERYRRVLPRLAIAP
jgi:hypothetical protein